MGKYSDAFKLEAIKLSDEIGLKKQHHRESFFATLKKEKIYRTYNSDGIGQDRYIQIHIRILQPEKDNDDQSARTATCDIPRADRAR